MSSAAKLSKKMKRKEIKINAENMKIKKKFLKLKGYRIEVAENSYILFENEQDYLNFIYLEKVVFDFINNLLYNKDLDKKLRIYFRLTLINNYLESFINYPEIKIFYDVRYENPFHVKFPFICCFEDLDKRGEYLKEIEILGRGKVKSKCVCGICGCDSVSDCLYFCDCRICDCLIVDDDDCDCDRDGYCCCECDDCLKCVCDDCDICECDCCCDLSVYGKLYYEGESLIYKYHKLTKLLYRRIDIEYYKIKSI